MPASLVYVLDPVQVPRQGNGWDCGAFVIKFGELVLRERRRLAALRAQHLSGRRQIREAARTLSDVAPTQADVDQLREQLREVSLLGRHEASRFP